MRNNETCPVAALLFLLILFTMVFVYLQPVSAQEFLKSYENPKLGFSVSYPSNWEVCRYNENFQDPPPNGGFVQFCDPKMESLDLSIDVVAPITMSPKDSVAQAIPHHESDARERGYNFQLFDQGSMTIGGKEAYGYTTILGQTKNTYIYIDVGNTRYNFQFGNNEPTYSDALIPIIEQIIKSAELTGISDDQGDELRENGDGGPFDNSDRGTSTGFPPTSESNTNNQVSGSLSQDSKPQQPCTAFTIGDGSCSTRKICPSGCILQHPIIIIPKDSDVGYMIAPAGSEITSEGEFKMNGPLEGERVGPYMVMTKK